MRTPGGGVGPPLHLQNVGTCRCMLYSRCCFFIGSQDRSISKKQNLYKRGSSWIYELAQHGDFVSCRQCRVHGLPSSSNATPATLGLPKRRLNMVKSGFQEEEQLWFLGVLDRKFQEQETAIRDLLLSIARPDVGQPFRERRTDLSVTAPMASDNMQSPRSSLARVREVRVTALSDTSDAYEGMKSEATPPAASPSNASASGTPNGKRSKALARAMNDDLTDKDPPAKAFIKHSLDAYMGLVVVPRFSPVGQWVVQVVVSCISGYKSRAHDHDGAVVWRQGRL